jgi:hypothetical protein
MKEYAEILIERTDGSRQRYSNVTVMKEDTETNELHFVHKFGGVGDIPTYVRDVTTIGIIVERVREISISGGNMKESWEIKKYVDERLSLLYGRLDKAYKRNDHVLISVLVSQIVELERINFE